MTESSSSPSAQQGSSAAPPAPRESRWLEMWIISRVREMLCLPVTAHANDAVRWTRTVLHQIGSLVPSLWFVIPRHASEIPNCSNPASILIEFADTFRNITA